MPNSGVPADGVCVVVPAYDEELAIEQHLRELEAVLSQLGCPYELIVVNDGSSDRTGEIARSSGARVIDLPENRGYGAALKTGIDASRFETIIITDADGTYPAREIPALLALSSQYDMVVGARIRADAAIPMVRRPAKWVLTRLASFLAGRRIPDLNSGLRILQRLGHRGRRVFLVARGRLALRGVPLAAPAVHVRALALPERHGPLDEAGRAVPARHRARRRRDGRRKPGNRYTSTKSAGPERGGLAWLAPLLLLGSYCEHRS